MSSELHSMLSICQVNLSEFEKSIQKGLTNGRGNIILIPLTNTNSIPHSTIGKFKASKLILRPSTPGSGVIAGSSMRTVLEMAGIKNILSKQLGSNNLLNNARATLKAVLPWRRPQLHLRDDALPARRTRRAVSASRR